MSTILTTPEEKKILRGAGRRLASVLREVVSAVRPDIKTIELDRLAERLIREGGDLPAFLNYTPDGADRPYPNTLCVSINNEVVHGVPGERILKEGDIVGLDLGLKRNGLFVDSAVTVPVGRVDDKALKLMETTKKALMAGISAARAGGRIGDIGSAVEKVGKKAGYSIVRVLGGHGVGKNVHERPYVPNYGKEGTGEILKEGLLLAIEPMFNEGGEDVVLDEDDGYTFRTEDGSRSAHFEHTILVTDTGAEIVTVE